MRRLAPVALAASAVALAAVALALALPPLLEVSIEGVVNVSSARVVDVKLTVDREEGYERFDLGEVAVGGGMLRVRAVLVDYEGDLRIAVSGELRLESEERSYTVAMPCAIVIGEPCYRVMVLIPGYDVPMPVESGTYRATLVLSWRARGSGRFHAKLYLEAVPGEGS